MKLPNSRQASYQGLLINTWRLTHQYLSSLEVLDKGYALSQFVLLLWAFKYRPGNQWLDKDNQLRANIRSTFNFFRENPEFFQERKYLEFRKLLPGRSNGYQGSFLGSFCKTRSGWKTLRFTLRRTAGRFSVFLFPFMRIPAVPSRIFTSLIFS